MLIDDSSSSNLYHKIMMEDAGMDIDSCVTEFISSTKAKSYLEELYNADKLSDFPDVILLDINIPVINGWDMVQFIEELNIPNLKTKIFMVSNSRSPLDLDKAKTYSIIEDILEKHVEEAFFTKLQSDHTAMQTNS